MMKTFARLQGMADLHALGRIDEVEEVATISCFLMTEWVTGTVLEIDGELALGLWKVERLPGERM